MDLLGAAWSNPLSEDFPNSAGTEGEIAPYDEKIGEEYTLRYAVKAEEWVNKCLKDGLSWKDIMIEAMAVCLAKSVEVSHIGGDKRRELERDIDMRLQAIESSAFEYSGAWKSDTKYRKNQFVTHRGSMWHAQIDCKGIVPGDGAIWKLAVKQGRDRERY